VSRSALRAEVFERDGYQCVWTECFQPAQELMHFHSIGAGGRKSADALDNVGAGCKLHARLSDGEYGSGGAAEYAAEHFKLFGGRYLELEAGTVAWERAEALRGLVDETSV